MEVEEIHLSVRHTASRSGYYSASGKIPVLPFWSAHWVVNCYNISWSILLYSYGNCLLWVTWIFTDSSRLYQETVEPSVTDRSYCFIALFGGISNPLIPWHAATPLTFLTFSNMDPTRDCIHGRLNQDVVSIFLISIYIYSNPLLKVLSHIAVFMYSSCHVDLK